MSFPGRSVHGVGGQVASEARQERFIEHARTEGIEFIRCKHGSARISNVSQREPVIDPCVVLIVLVCLLVDGEKIISRTGTVG